MLIKLNVYQLKNIFLFLILVLIQKTIQHYLHLFLIQYSSLNQKTPNTHLLYLIVF